MDRLSQMEAFSVSDHSYNIHLREHLLPALCLHLQNPSWEAA